MWWIQQLGDASIFLTSTLGILIQVTVFSAAIIAGVKFLNKKLDERIDSNIDAKLNPLVEGLCKQLGEVTEAMKIHKAATETALVHITKAVEFLQELKIADK